MFVQNLLTIVQLEVVFAEACLFEKQVREHLSCYIPSVFEEQISLISHLRSRLG